MKKINFGLIGVSGYIAPRHLQAIKNNNCSLDACVDVNDSVGIIDKYFEDYKFFNKFEPFERYLSKRQFSNNKIDYISICSPNYLHDTHIRLALQNNCDVICEKPVVLYPHNLINIKEIEKKTKKKVYTILQLRNHPNVKKIIEEVRKNKNQTYDIELTYITFRGPWYHYSWKGDINKSGGITTNIGIHLFDLLYYIFGKCKENIIHLNEHNKASGYLELEKAKVKWFLSIDKSDLPRVLKNGQKSFRSISINGKEFDLSSGFEDLHDISYRDILNGKGFAIDQVSETIDIVSQIRLEKPVRNNKNKHPFLKVDK